MIPTETRALLVDEALEYVEFSSHRANTDTDSVTTSMDSAQEGLSVQLRVAMEKARTPINPLAPPVV
jgi:hypothetical protein